MAVLTPQQRNTLETVVKQARRIAETGALNALQGLAIKNSEPFAHMSAGQRGLRNSLRSKARLLGDVLLDDGTQSINHLSYELAYETWHKMLFAKFLEANGLLMHPDGVAVTMVDCEELAKDEGFVDKWDAAAGYASKMLPAIFRTEDPLMQVVYATDERIKLEEIIDALEFEIFTADDALGWVYQFWQSDAKKKVEEEEKSGQKIDGERLPAKTQLFTEPYMVHFLVDNTLGAWWVNRNPGIKPPIKFQYLKLLDDGTPAAGIFEGWPDKTAGITSLDPCMGSGHFIASLFPVFALLRMHEECITKEQATDKVITENLHGLELDARCTQIAAFNLAVTAWKFCGYYRELPDMNLACSGIAPKGKMEDWVKLVDGVNRPDDKLRLENGMKVLYEHFQLAPELGSLLDPTTIKADAFIASFEQLQPVLRRALENDADIEQLERGVVAAGIAKAGQLLAKKYTLQITNVPYLSRGKQASALADYIEKNYPEAKGDLATVFLDKMLKSNSHGGIFCSVIPQNWLFLTSYKKFREKLLKNVTWNMVVKLGAKAFKTPMWDFNVMLISLSNIKPTSDKLLMGLDVSEAANALLKEQAIKINLIKAVSQKEQLINPDARIILDEVANIDRLEKFAFSSIGLSTSDTPLFVQYFWEHTEIGRDWEYHQSTTEKTTEWGGCEHVVLYENCSGRMRELAAAQDKDRGRDRQGINAWGKKGISIGLMGTLPSTLFLGNKFDNNMAAIVPFDDKNLPAIWCYCSSKEFCDEVRRIDQKLNVTNGTLVKVPFDLEYWRNIAEKAFPNSMPKPQSDDAIQWLFHGNPVKTDRPIQVALARILGYRWPAETDLKMELADESRELIKSVTTFNQISDEDGIFCIPSVNAEEGGAERLRTFLQEVFAKEWGNQTITQLLAKEGTSSSNLEDWLRKEFFIQHCKLFQNRPFIWHIWDGRNDGFSALVNYHKLDKDNLSKLIYTYLGDWIRICEAKKRAGESGAEGLLSAALKLKEKLEAILHGEAPCDIFVRWKPMEQQPIGWDPDLNDGVRINIRPFVEAGVLRSKFNLKWGVDRGKNPPGSPWGEIRDNDKHLTLEEKKIARENTQILTKV